MDALPSKLLKNDAALDAGPSARGTRVERCLATAIDRWCFGGARRDRTDDLLLAKQALSQLSYGPVSTLRPGGRHLPGSDLQEDPATKGMVGLERFELSTSRLSSARSNQLSYRPGKRGRRPNEERETKAAVSRQIGLTGHCVSKRSDKLGTRRHVA